MVKEKKEVRERELMLSPKSIRRSDGHSSRDEQSANALVQEKAGFLDFTPQQLSSPNTMVWSSVMSEMVMEAMLGKLCRWECDLIQLRAPREGDGLAALQEKSD